MGCNQDCCIVSCLIVSSFFFRLWSSIQAIIMAEGASRVNVKLVEVTQHRLDFFFFFLMGSKEKEVVTSHIGMKPPRCEGKCGSCRPCKPILVVDPLQKNSILSCTQSKKNPMVWTIVYSKGENSPDYKPLIWNLNLDKKSVNREENDSGEEKKYELGFC
ncbi:hypothetical protein NE237_016337 [Protea cynaroides]|uniref:Epidermal patterning factor-like protein n=1 Tax=Protea cynaroides TaxID=273540 RepID=A0A9Q0GMY1_9MAGN|nr:hypothetical protein NE237_016337 [Protea cynaroides]